MLALLLKKMCKNFALVNSHLLLEKTTTDNVQSKTADTCPEKSLRRAIVVIIYLYILQKRWY